MFILYVITKADEIGGAQIHIRDFSIRMKEIGHKVGVVVGENGALVEQLSEYEIECFIVPELVREISPLKDFQCLKKLRKLLKIYQPDLLSLHSSKAGILGRLAAWRLNIPVIFTAHGWSFANGVSIKSKLLYILIERLMAKFADKIITVSQQDKDLAIKYKVSTDAKQIVIHNGMPDFSRKNIKPTNIDMVYLISVARFSNQKDHKTLFHALSSLKHLNWKLTLVGKGPLLEQMVSLSKEFDIFSRIDFLGERNDVACLLDKSDIFLLISNWEGFPRSILEAMRSGLPVIASNVGGVIESVHHDYNGYVVERGDFKKLSFYLSKLIQDPEKRVELGKHGRKLFEDEFIFDSMFNKTYTLYNELLDLRNRDDKLL